MSAMLIIDHGEGHEQWVKGQSSGSGPLQVARAAPLMPPPFEPPSAAIRDLLVPLLETGLTSLERAETGSRAALRRVQALEAEVARAKSHSSELE